MREDTLILSQEWGFYKVRSHGAVSSGKGDG